MDGNVSFVVGTQIDSVAVPDAEEVPVAKILDYVSPAELERYENQEFFEEDERERLLPPKKYPGRPRKGDLVAPSFTIIPIGDETPREGSLLPEGITSISKRPGRPKGSYGNRGSEFISVESSVQSSAHIGRPMGSLKRGPKKTNAHNPKPAKLNVLSEGPTNIKRGRGRPPRQNKLAVVIPSFNGPQPQKLRSTPGLESESDEILHDPKPQYSMVAASGLDQLDSEDVTSRDQSVELVPTSKKRRLATRNTPIDISLDDNDDEASPHPTKRVKQLPETSPDPIADDSIALLRQFQARVYGPDPSSKASTIPHRVSKPSSNPSHDTTPLAQCHGTARLSDLDSRSSDPLMGPTQRPLRPLPTQYVQSKPLSGEISFPQRAHQKNNPAKISKSYLNNSITVSRFPQRELATATSTEQISPSKPIPRKVSLTPHFPPNTSFSHKKSMNGSTERRLQSSLSSSSRHARSQPADRTFSRTMPSTPKKTKPSPESKSAPSQSSQTASISKIGFTGLPPAKDITDFFAPKPTVVESAPTRASNSPSLQLLVPEKDSGDSENESESEDQLAQRSSTDSISSEVIVVRQSSPTAVNQAVSAEATPQEPSSRHDYINLDFSENDSSQDESQDEHKGKTGVSNTTALIQSTTNPRKTESTAEVLSKAFEFEDDEDSDSGSDSLSSEVMVIRSI